MSAGHTFSDSLDIPVDPNRRPVDDPEIRRLLTAQNRKPQTDSDSDPWLPPIPRKYPEPTD